MKKSGFQTYRAGRVFPLVFALLAAACGGGSSGIEAPAPVDDQVAAAAATITAEDMIERIAFLASDEMRGRDTPSPELERTAQWIADEFRRMGLEGGMEDGSYIQRYPFPLIALDTAAAGFVARFGDEEVVLDYGSDFLVSFGAASASSGPGVFVGDAGEFAASSPAAGSLADRIVFVSLPGGLDQEWQRAVGRARAAAVTAGADVVVYMLDEDFTDEQFEQLAGSLERGRRSLGGTASGIAMVLLRADAADHVFQAAASDRASAVAQASGSEPLEIATSVSVMSPYMTIADDEAPNVVAMLRGSDPELREEYVVFSAHMDHVGVGRPDASGDSIYNGADDNASGTAALIEVAEAFSYLLERPARSLVFLAVSGEEKGLLGSRWYSENPTVPVESIVANINVDMIGRNAADSIVVIGQEYSSLGPLVNRVAAANPELGLTVSTDIWPEERFFFRSDHFNFARLEIPALFFFAGVHEDYHRPSDHVEEIDGDKAARVARLIFHTAHAIADTPEAPEWTEEGLEEIRALTARGR